jgi:hypothetical protein
MEMRLIKLPEEYAKNKKTTCLLHKELTNSFCMLIRKTKV